MANPRVPVHLFLNCPGGPVSKTLPATAGTILILNTGTVPVWINLAGVAVAAAADADGRTKLLAGGPALNLTNTNVGFVKANSAAGGALQIVMLQDSDEN
jgi:hypothetical protein